jgi:hypothetical protein
MRVQSTSRQVVHLAEFRPREILCFHLGWEGFCNPGSVVLLCERHTARQETYQVFLTRLVMTALGHKIEAQAIADGGYQRALERLAQNSPGAVDALEMAGVHFASPKPRTRMGGVTARRWPSARLWAPPIPLLARGLGQWDVHSKRPPEGGVSGSDRKPGDRNRYAPRLFF